MSSGTEKEEEKPIVAKTAVDLQRLKLMKLMKHPEKPVILPERPKAKNTPTVPEFVRNVMGSSAGAGSGEFHVYRHLRRKEYARQKFIQEKGRKELLDEEYHRKLEENKKAADELTAKKRAKRLKKKQKQKGRKKMKNTKSSDDKSDEHMDNTESESDETESESCNFSKDEQFDQCQRIVESTSDDEGKNCEQKTIVKNSEYDSNVDKLEQSADIDNSKVGCDENETNAESEKQSDTEKSVEGKTDEKNEKCEMDT